MFSVTVKTAGLLRALLHPRTITAIFFRQLASVTSENTLSEACSSAKDDIEKRASRANKEKRRAQWEERNALAKTYIDEREIARREKISIALRKHWAERKKEQIERIVEKTRDKRQKATDEEKARTAEKLRASRNVFWAKKTFEEREKYLAYLRGEITEQRKAKLSAAMRARWEGKTPEERKELMAHLQRVPGSEKQIAWQKARWADKTPEERKALTAHLKRPPGSEKQIAWQKARWGSKTSEERAS